jgi:hypothetical protein
MAPEYYGIVLGAAVVAALLAAIFGSAGLVVAVIVALADR